jgi:hypothetical protein
MSHTIEDGGGVKTHDPARRWTEDFLGDVVVVAVKG